MREGSANGGISSEVRAPLLWMHRWTAQSVRQVLQWALQAGWRQDRAPVWLPAPRLPL